MSKYLAFSLMIVMMMIGIIGGFAVARSPKSGQRTAGLMEATSDATYSDQRFLEDMIKHHEEAIEMSSRVLKHTSRKEVRDLATAIITTQSEEVGKMKEWLQEWK